MDTLTRKQRSRCMSQIRRKNTAVEIKFRKYLWQEGFRNYRIDAKILGRPDVYFSKKRIAIFIDGCFWHKCSNCFVKPKSNLSYWAPKIKKNVLRDKKNSELLKRSNIKVLRFWEHEIKNNSKKCYNTFVKVYEKRSQI